MVGGWGSRAIWTMSKTKQIFYVNYFPNLGKQLKMQFERDFTKCQKSRVFV